VVAVFATFITSQEAVMARFARPKITPALVISCAALFIALGGTGYAATGEALILGQDNASDAKTTLVGKTGGPALQLTNSKANAGSTALGLKVAHGHPPFTTTSSTLVTNLNADQLDGFDATAFARFSGLILGDGTISSGTGFSVSHVSEGEYQISFPDGSLSSNACPPVAVAIPFSGLLRHVLVAGRSCSGSGGGSVTLIVVDADAVAHDTPLLWFAI
jgi:hypothetical protein